MPQLSVRSTEAWEAFDAEESLAVSPPVVTPLTETTEWAESPARMLHDRLVQAFATPHVRDETKLSGRTRLLIAAVAMTLPWLVIGAVTMAILA